MHSCPAGSPPGDLLFSCFRGFCVLLGALPSVPLPCLVSLGHAVLCGLNMAEVPKDRGSGAVVW